MIETYPNIPGVHMVTYEPTFSALCAIGNVPFYGVLEITYVPKGELLEFSSFERWLVSDVAKMETTVEGLCRHVFDVLADALSPDVVESILLSVTVSARSPLHAPTSASISSGDFMEGD